MSPRRVPTQVERDLDARMAAWAGDEERVEVLRRARAFKSSWIDLGDALSVVQSLESWRAWGYDTFESYCRDELHLRRETALKLVGSFSFLRARAPDLFEREEADAPMPSLESVAFWKRAEERSADLQIPEEDRQALRRAVIDEGMPVASLRRRFASTFFPPREDDEDRARGALRATARRLRDLVEATDLVPQATVRRVSAALDQLLRALEGEEDDRDTG